MSTITYGANVVIDATFADDTGAAVDPDVVRCYVKQAGSSETLYTYGSDASLQRTGVGAYQLTLPPPTEATTWSYRWEAVAELTTSAYAGEFIIGRNRA